MGRSQSKDQSAANAAAAAGATMGNNPWEADVVGGGAAQSARMRERREQSALREQERRARKAQRLAEKESKKQQQKKKKQKGQKQKQRRSRLEELRDTEPPPIVRKSKARLDENDYDSEAKRRMQHQLACNSDIFVLNQLMLGVQFYGNFEREMWEAVERNRAEENRRNGRTSRHCKTVILPDRLLEAVDRRVKFYAKHGPYKNRLLPLHAQTCYIVHDNIEITNPGDSSVYSILTDAPIYKLEIEDAIEEKLMLRLPGPSLAAAAAITGTGASASSGAGGEVVRRRRTQCHHGYIKLRSVEFIKPNNPSVEVPVTSHRASFEQRSLSPGPTPGSSGLARHQHRHRRPTRGPSNGGFSLSDSDTLDDDDDDDDGDEDDHDEDDEEVGQATARGNRGFRKLQFRDSIAVGKYASAKSKPASAGQLANGNIGGKANAAGSSKRTTGQQGGGLVGVPSTSTSSTSPPSSEYDYAYITAINTHQPLSVMRSAGGGAGSELTAPLSTTVLPDYAITTISCPIEVPETGVGYYSDDESETLDKLTALYGGSGGGTAGGPRADRPDYARSEQRQYLNSKGFLAYFVNLFQDRLAAELEIPAEDVREATWKGAVVYSGQWEIIPAILCPWPREATEWVHRKRDVKINPLTKQKFQWPTPPMIQKVRSFGCHVIPVGYAPKQGQNRYRQLEWKIVFPEADRYLESCLSGTQIKLYMVAKLLLRTFVEPSSQTLGCGMFGLEHLRAHLFWQCEQNYAAWPEDYLGEALLRFLNALLDRIKTHKLPDYFLPSRNLFENVPERVLVELHRRIFRVTENPVMHLLVALRNLKLPSGAGFYPKLRIKRLYSYLVIDNPLKIVNPMLRDEDENLAAEDSDEAAVNEREIAVGSMAYYNQQEIESRRKRTRIVRFLVAEQLRKDRADQPVRRQSVESIDLTFLPLKHMENLRRQLIYSLFVEHFTEMARISCQFRALNQALIYLRQSERLCNLLADDEGVEEAQQYLTKIYGLRQELALASAKGPDRPALPRRTSSSLQQQQQPQHLKELKQPLKSPNMRQQRRPSARIAYSNVRSSPMVERAQPAAKIRHQQQQQQRFLRQQQSTAFSPDTEDEGEGDWVEYNEQQQQEKEEGAAAADHRLLRAQKQQQQQQQQQVSVQIHSPRSPGPRRSMVTRPPLPTSGPRRSSDDIEDISRLLGNVAVR